MSTNHTPNYNLCQWEADDKVLRTEFNEDNAKLDAAIAAVAAKVPAVNLSCYTTSYSGNGPQSGYTTRTHTFPHKPMVLLIQSSNRMYFSFRGTSVLYCPSFVNTSFGSVSWGENSVTLSASLGDNAANESGYYYYLFALLES